MSRSTLHTTADVQQVGPFPCIICEKPLQREIDEEGQPSDGLMCSTLGNYGSKVFSSIDESYLSFNICDDCLKAKAAKGLLKMTRHVRPVVMDNVGVIGTERVDRPYLDWHPGIEQEMDRLHLNLDELETLPDHVALNQGLTVEQIKERYQHSEHDAIAYRETMKG